jgi:hypothetical protein
MTKSQKTVLYLTMILVGFSVSCKMLGSSGTDSNKPNNSNSNLNINAATPAPTATNYEAKNLLIYVKSPNSEVGKMLENKEIIVLGEVWKGGNRFGGPFNFEYWTSEGRINCYGNIPTSTDAKASALDKATGDYLNKRTNRMPFVKAKGIFKTSSPPSAKPNDFWNIILENCEILEVTP